MYAVLFLIVVATAVGARGAAGRETPTWLLLAVCVIVAILFTSRRIVGS